MRQAELFEDEVIPRNNLPARGPRRRKRESADSDVKARQSRQDRLRAALQAFKPVAGTPAQKERNL